MTKIIFKTQISLAAFLTALPILTSHAAAPSSDATEKMALSAFAKNGGVITVRLKKEVSFSNPYDPASCNTSDPFGNPDWDSQADALQCQFLNNDPTCRARALPAGTVLQFRADGIDSQFRNTASEAFAGVTLTPQLTQAQKALRKILIICTLGGNRKGVPGSTRVILANSELTASDVKKALNAIANVKATTAGSAAPHQDARVPDAPDANDASSAQ